MLFSAVMRTSLTILTLQVTVKCSNHVYTRSPNVQALQVPTSPTDKTDLRYLWRKEKSNHYSKNSKIEKARFSNAKTSEGQQRNRRHTLISVFRNITSNEELFNVSHETNEKFNFCPDFLLHGAFLMIKNIGSKPDDLIPKFPFIKNGGRFAPTNCIPKYSVAILVPYRDRSANLHKFLQHMHVFLTQQSLDYGIYIIEQYGHRPFNRGKLVNAGFVEAWRDRGDDDGWDCIVIHDVDLLPTNPANLYFCPNMPRQLCPYINKNQPPYETNFGGVCIMARKHFEAVNGFPNNYWGWGGEDDDLYTRIFLKALKATRSSRAIGQCVALPHQTNPHKSLGAKLLARTRKEWRNNGLNSLKYTLISTYRHKLYTKFIVNIDTN